MVERTLIIIKPDGIQRLLAGQIISRFETRGFKLVAAKFLHISEELAHKLYVTHQGKSFLKGLVKFISSSPSLVMVWEAEDIIEIVRRMLGATFGRDAESRYEINLFFKPDEIVDYELANAHWIYGVND